MDKLSYKRTFFLSLLFIALGITFNATLKGSIGSVGTVLIAIGGLFLIASMAKKRKEEQNNKNN